MILSLVLFEKHFNCFWSYILTVWPFFRISVISEFLFLGIGLKTKTWKSQKNIHFRFYSTKIHLDLFFDHYFYYLSIKIDINKKKIFVNFLSIFLSKIDINKIGVNSLYPEGSTAFKTQIPATWLAIWWIVFILMLFEQHFNFF